MKIKRIAIVAVFISIMWIGIIQTAAASDLIVVATKDTYEASQKWVDFLTLNEVSIQHVSPREFDKYKKKSGNVIRNYMRQRDLYEIILEDGKKITHRNGRLNVPKVTPIDD